MHTFIKELLRAEADMEGIRRLDATDAYVRLRIPAQAPEWNNLTGVGEASLRFTQGRDQWRSCLPSWPEARKESVQMNKQTILRFLTKMPLVISLQDMKVSQQRFGIQLKAPRTVSGNG